MWVRWDESGDAGDSAAAGPGTGKAASASRPGKRFNLEATSARCDGGGVGSFVSLTDEQLAEILGTPREDIESGSDFTSLTARQTLGVYLQSRAGYWASRGDWRRAAADIELAHALFPQNRDIVLFLKEARGRVSALQTHGPDEPWRRGSSLGQTRSRLVPVVRAPTCHSGGAERVQGIRQPVNSRPGRPGSTTDIRS